MGRVELYLAREVHVHVCTVRHLLPDTIRIFLGNRLELELE